jgi:hypothetical protein
MNDFETAIAALDLSLFKKIESQSTDEDKRSFLAIQRSVRELRPSYVYLEIGSYLGGSIQPFLLDERCRRIFSIDKRPSEQPDERGTTYKYSNNSTSRMLENLSTVSPTDKITTIEGSTAEIDPSMIDEKADLCFIDGEHTDAAVLSDFKFCLWAMAENAAIVFHDATVTYNGISNCVKYLDENGVKFLSYNLPNIIFVIEIGDFPLHQDPVMIGRMTSNHLGYLYSLQANDYYRQFAKRAPFRLYRNLLAKLRGANRFD